MLAKVLSCAVVGLEGAIVEVEVDISLGLPSFTIVGLPDTAVQEARERVPLSETLAACYSRLCSPGEICRRQVTPLNLEGLLRSREVIHRYGYQI